MKKRPTETPVKDDKAELARNQAKIQERLAAMNKFTAATAPVVAAVTPAPPEAVQIKPPEPEVKEAPVVDIVREEKAPPAEAVGKGEKHYTTVTLTPATAERVSEVLIQTLNLQIKQGELPRPISRSEAFRLTTIIAKRVGGPIAADLQVLTAEDGRLKAGGSSRRREG